jgi:hypothetical protein
LRVVFHLAGLYQAGVEFLVGTQINDLPDDFSPRCSQSDDVNPFRLTPRTVAVCVDGAQRHNTFPLRQPQWPAASPATLPPPNQLRAHSGREGRPFKLLSPRITECNRIRIESLLRSSAAKFTLLRQTPSSVCGPSIDAGLIVFIMRRAMPALPPGNMCQPVSGVSFWG